MRTVFDIFAQIFRNLWAHKLRSFLTMFGIAWGVGSLLLLVGVGEGFRSGNKREMAEFGRDIMFIFPGRAPAVAGSMNSARTYLLTYEDYQDIRKEAPHVRNASPMLSRTDLHEVSEFASAGVEIIGVEPQLNEISYLPPPAIAGRIRPAERNPFRSDRQHAASRSWRQYVAEYARLHPVSGDGYVLSDQRRKP